MQFSKEINNTRIQDEDIFNPYLWINGKQPLGIQLEQTMGFQERMK